MQYLMMRASHFLRIRIIIILHVSYRELFVRTIHRTVTRFHSEARRSFYAACMQSKYVYLNRERERKGGSSRHCRPVSPSSSSGAPFLARASIHE